MSCVDVNIVRKGGHKDVTVTSVSGWNGDVALTRDGTTVPTIEPLQRVGVGLTRRVPEVDAKFTKASTSLGLMFSLVCTTNIGVVEYYLLDKSGLYLTDVSGRYLIETKGE